MRVGCRRWLKQRKGAAMVELAIVLPLLTLIMFGVVEAGNAWHREQVLATAAREGVRRGAIWDPAIGLTDVQHAVNQYLVGGGIDSTQVTMTTNWGTVTSGQDVIVTLMDTLRFPVLSRLTGALPAKRVLTITATMRKE